MRGDTETHCHCGADYRGSDHCPRCHCEQYESLRCPVMEQTEETIGRVVAGTGEYVYGKGRQVKASRNVMGNLFITIGPIYGSAGDEGGIKEAAEIVEAVGRISSPEAVAARRDAARSA